jgi:sulfide dehydrogenase cytochrome subunit
MPTLARASLLAVGCAFALPAAAATPSPSMLAYPCAGCHGTDGESVYSAPILKGQSKEDIVRAMREYRDGTRVGTIMQRIAKGYTEAEIEAMASFFAQPGQGR